MSSITQWAWSGVPDAETGTLTMWPGTADELDPWDQHLLQRPEISAELAKEKTE